MFARSFILGISAVLLVSSPAGYSVFSRPTTTVKAEDEGVASTEAAPAATEQPTRAEQSTTTSPTSTPDDSDDAAAASVVSASDAVNCSGGAAGSTKSIPANLSTTCCGLPEQSKSGAHVLKTSTFSTALAYCDMERDHKGGAWMLFMRKIKSSNFDEHFFDKDMKSYEEGFGDLEGEVWYGLKPLNHLLTDSNTTWELKVNLTFENRTDMSVTYDKFSVGDSDSSYTLSVSDPSVRYEGLTIFDGNKFSAKDTKNTDRDCTADCHGGWWYHKEHCLERGSVMTADGYNCNNWEVSNGVRILFVKFEMWIRPSSCPWKESI